MKKRIISFLTSIAIALTVFFGFPGIEANAAECTMTADEAINWLNQNFTNGQKGGQCLAFVNNYIYALCGKAMNAQTAWCISCKWETGSNYDGFGVFNSSNYPFTFIKGNSSMSLQKGDILLYHYADGAWNNSCFCGQDHYSCGHIGIYESENRWYDSNGDGSNNEIYRIRTTSPRWSTLYGVLRPNFKSSSSSSTTAEVPAATGYPVNDGVYQIRSVSLPGYQLNVYGGTDADGTGVCSWGYDNSIEQRFRFQHVGYGAYRIYAMCSGGGNSRVLDVNIGSDNTLGIGDTIDIWSVGGYDNCQLFNMIPIGNGNYIIELASMHNAVIGITTQGNGASITLQRYTGADTQHWFLVDPGVEGIRSSYACTHLNCSETVTKAATCLATGTKTKTCAWCSKTTTETIAKTGHNYSTSWTIDKAATCTTTGSKSHHCTVCGAKSDVTTIPTAAHNYSTAWTIDKAATCTTAGSKSHHCTVCGAKGDVTTIAALGHSWNDGVVTTNPTYTATGVKTFTCKTCGATKTETVAKLSTSNIPQNVKATSASHQIKLTWSAVNGAKGYIVKSADGKTQYTAKSITATSYTVKGLTNSKQYKFKIYAYVDGKWYGSSTVSKTPTGAPQNVTATAGSKKVTLSWDKVDGATGYIVKSADGKIQYTAKSIKTNSYTVTGLTGGTQYKFKVYAYVDGKWYASATKSKTPKA